MGRALRLHPSSPALGRALTQKASGLLAQQVSRPA
jgi:hypothetical protein